MSQTEDLPNDLEACRELIRERYRYEEQQDEINESLARDNERLKFEIEQLKRYIYGQRSERHLEDDSQLPLFNKHPESAAEIEDDAEVVEEEIT
jgi:transposase